ncbi:MAG: 1-acyl-sn-glycerol-3-phosphate acyltransferase [Candidatus Omnitrophica bacterium]|nr:1-acyl-sn-glycerol-3-phosphate acyltransferase [Candidatus Omnitrophota bacterium]
MIVPLCYAFSQGTLRLIFGLGFGLRVHGLEHVPRRGGVIVAANHVSYLDPPVLGAACPRRLRFMAKANLFRHPLLGGYLRSVGVIPIVREESDLGAVREGIARLRRGEALAIFPEGGRQISGQLGEAKRGVGLLAAAARVPVVPAFIRGTFEAWPRGGTAIRRAKIRVAFGKPIPYTMNPLLERADGDKGSGRARSNHQALAEEVTRRWQRLRDQLHG